MNITYVRSSSLNTYTDCQHRFFCEYLLELPAPSGKKALLGTAIHLVLELLARVKKTGHYLINDKFCDPEYLLKICWSRFVKEEGHVFELTNADYKFCQRSVAKVLAGPYHPFNLSILDIEKRFILPINRKGFSYELYDIIAQTTKRGRYELRGTIDLITKLDSDTIEVLDYKSGKRKCWTSGVEKDFIYLSKKDMQLRLYDLAVSLLYPQYKNRIITIHYINDGGPFTVSFSDESREKMYKHLFEHFNSVRTNKLPSRIKDERSNQSWKCKYVCPFGKKTEESDSDTCDKIYNHMIHHGMDATILKIDELKKKKKNGASGGTSNRRNIY